MDEQGRDKAIGTATKVPRTQRRREVWEAPRVVSTALKDTEKLFAADEVVANDDPSPGPS
jgi:hypothetical protein